jgi:acyl dehydratase
MYADEVLLAATSLGSPGIAEARFMKPVFPGDTLSARYTCAEKRILKSRPGVGMCRMQFELLNQQGEIVMTWDTQQLYRIRHPERAA